MEKQLKLPEDFEQTKLYLGPSFGDGHEILFNYCNLCIKKPECGMKKTLANAMGDNFPYWSEEFIAVEYRENGPFSLSHRRVLCAEYESPQTKLPGIDLPFSDGVNRLVEIVEKEREKNNLLASRNSLLHPFKIEVGSIIE